MESVSQDHRLYHLKHSERTEPHSASDVIPSVFTLSSAARFSRWRNVIILPSDLSLLSASLSNECASCECPRIESAFSQRNGITPLARPFAFVLFMVPLSFLFRLVSEACMACGVFSYSLLCIRIWFPVIGRHVTPRSVNAHASRRQKQNCKHSRSKVK